MAGSLTMGMHIMRSPDEAQRNPRLRRMFPDSVRKQASIRATILQ